MTSTVRAGRYDPEHPYAALEDIPPRHAALMGATSGLRPSRGRSFPLETLMLVLGGLLLPIGVITIIIGWYGAAHTPKLYEQNDYLISGGILGLGLVFIGGFLYFGYWVTRQIRTTNVAAQQTLRALSRIEAQLAGGANSTNGTNGNGNGHGQAAAPPGAEEERTGGRRGRSEPEVTERPGGRGVTATAVPHLVATEKGTLFHRPDCPVVANKDNLRVVDPDTPGFRACQICNPLG
ncbi:MAG TPA: hypothetical protein VFV02_14900 [Acidimicrobiales bacterium]|nr:hypothetical protein [Acidimicrobiales bacterium]